MNSSVQVLMMVALLMMGLTGVSRLGVCADPDPTVSPQASPSPVASVAVATQLEEPDFLKLRDPFQRPVKAQPVSAVPRTILEGFELTELKMVGVLTGPHQMKALIIDPKGTSHFVGLNTRIGIHQGKVIQILGDRIRVREKIENMAGKLEDLDSDLLIQADGHPLLKGEQQSSK